MNLLIFRTDIKSKNKVKTIKPILNNHPTISEWSVDLEDIDNVLRIEAQDDLSEKDIIHMIKKCGFYCEMLPD